MNIMQNTQKISTQSNGIVLIAYQSKQIDYVKLATVCAKLIKKHMVNNNITLLTDQEVSDSVFDNVILADPDGPISRRPVVGTINNDIWINGNRPNVYEVSPYDNTLLLDVDYFVFNNSLDALFGSVETFCFHDKVYDCADSKSLEKLHTFGHYRMPHHWATVMYFTKCPESEALFSAMKMVRDNWTYYRKFYRIHESRMYRNDFSLGIAYDLVKGFMRHKTNFIPWHLTTLPVAIEVAGVNDKGIEFVSVSAKRMRCSTQGNNVHVLQKANNENLMEQLENYATT